MDIALIPHAKLVTVEIDDLAFLKVRAATVTRAIVCLADSPGYLATRDGRYAVTGAFLGTMADLARIGIWKCTKCLVSASLVPMTFLRLTCDSRFNLISIGSLAR